MKPDLYDLSKEAQGLPLLFTYDEKSGKVQEQKQLKNTLLYSAATIMPQLLAGNTNYKLGAMYLEFKNGTDGSHLPSIPTYDRTGGIAYYNGLEAFGTSPILDYLRIPLIMVPTFTNSDSSGNYTGNIVTFFATSTSLTGRWGRTFNQTQKSAVYGVAIAATPDINDPSQDIVFARTYSNVGTLYKYDGSQIGVLYPFQFS